MDGLPQRPEADASLAFLQGLDEERPLSKKLTGSQRPLAPSEAGSSSTMDHPNAVDRRRKRMAVSASSEDGAAKRLKIASTDQDVVVVGTTRPSRYDISQHVRAEVWQHIFTLVPPRSLGKLMCVNRLFHKYLDPTSSFKVSAPDSDLPSLLPKLAPNNIWRASRHSHWPSMPSPLSGRSELDMWRFACSRSCQFCGRVDETDYAGDPLPWSRGPGNNTVTHVFQFFVTSCGQCLVKNSVKEVDLLLSASIPSFIAAGAPTVFITAGLNVVSRQIMRNSPLPTGVQLTKVFWPAQLERFQAEFEDARRLGTAAVEEWFKGLESRGASAIRDASKWENWYLSGGVRRMRRQSSSTHITSSSNNRHVQHSECRQAQEGIKESNSKRRADIEARAAQLHPPILPGVLHKLQAFQVASEVTTPLDDNEWKVLKLLLLDQRDKAEQGGRIAAPKKLITHKYPTRSKAAGIQAAEPRVQHHPDSNTRADLFKLADKVVNGQYNEGQTIKKKHLATFTSRVLTCVRDQYHADSSKTKPSPMRRLTLDDIRWIFDQKIAPLSKHPGAEVFLCSKCPTSKRYSFQGVIQHYCQMHCGNVKMSVLWKTEWTAELPFKPAPGPGRHSLIYRTKEGGDQTLKSRAAILSEDLAPAWSALMAVRNLPRSVKVSAAIYFMAKRYQEMYQEPAPWELLTFKLAGLAHHFHQTHEHVDWRTGMVWVPDLPQDIRDAIRKNKRALELISDALPCLLEDKEGVDQGDLVLSQCRQPPPSANQGAKDAVTGPPTHPTHLNPAKKPGETLHIVPASAVYSTPDVVHKELAYRTNLASKPNIEETGFRVHEPSERMLAQHSAREIEETGGAAWQRVHAHVRSRTIDSRHVAPEPRSYGGSYYAHREHEPHTREPLVSYPYYPDVERQRQQVHAAVEVRHASRQPCTTRYYNPPMSSAAAYHYAEPDESDPDADLVNYTRREPH
ncbi:hypothetical protein TgHK011_006041 [Trichoderma gracile]|nr:hypothetical protein TgHK011_006041 [Trichoderma gracile]